MRPKDWETEKAALSCMKTTREHCLLAIDGYHGVTDGHVLLPHCRVPRMPKLKVG